MGTTKDIIENIVKVKYISNINPPIGTLQCCVPALFITVVIYSCQLS